MGGAEGRPVVSPAALSTTAGRKRKVCWDESVCSRDHTARKGQGRALAPGPRLLSGAVSGLWQASASLPVSPSLLSFLPDSHA